MKLTIAIVMYANKHGLPADLKAVHYTGDDFEYLGQGKVNANIIPASGSVAIIVEKPAADFDGPVRLDFWTDMSSWLRRRSRGKWPSTRGRSFKQSRLAGRCRRRDLRARPDWCDQCRCRR